MSIEEAVALKKPTILAVDDSKENLMVVGQLLQPYYHVRIARLQAGIESGRQSARPESGPCSM